MDAVYPHKHSFPRTKMLVTDVVTGKYIEEAQSLKLQPA